MAFLRPTFLLIAFALLFLASPSPCHSDLRRSVTLACFATASQINAIPCHRSAIQFHAVALPLLSFRCYAIAMLCYSVLFRSLSRPIRCHTKPGLRLALPRLSVASLGLAMPLHISAMPGYSLLIRCFTSHFHSDLFDLFPDESSLA